MITDIIAEGMERVTDADPVRLWEPDPRREHEGLWSAAIWTAALCSAGIMPLAGVLAVEYWHALEAWQLMADTWGRPPFRLYMAAWTLTVGGIAAGGAPWFVWGAMISRDHRADGHHGLAVLVWAVALVATLVLVATLNDTPLHEPLGGPPPLGE